MEQNPFQQVEQTAKPLSHHQLIKEGAVSLRCPKQRYMIVGSLLAEQEVRQIAIMWVLYVFVSMMLRNGIITPHPPTHQKITIQHGHIHEHNSSVPALLPMTLATALLCDMMCML